MRPERFAISPRVRRSLDRVWVVGLVAFVAAIAVAGYRYLEMDRDISRFIGAGDNYVNARQAPPDLDITVGDGYDGQFYYRLALAPSSTAVAVHGIRFDQPEYRQQRIIYSGLAWLVGRGDPTRTMWALVGINVAGIGVLGLIGAAAARHYGRHAFLGILLPSYPGYVITFSKDTNEIVAAGLLSAGILALSVRRPVIAAPALAAAALAKESTLLLAFAIGVAWLFAPMREHGERSRRLVDLVPAAVPLVTYGVWALIIRDRWGAFPQENIAVFGAPFVAFGRFVSDSMRNLSVETIGQLIEAGLLVFGSILAIRALRGSAAPAAVKIGAVVMMVAAFAIFGHDIWVIDLGFLRAFNEGWVFIVFVLLALEDWSAPALLASSSPIVGARVLALD